MVGHRDQVVVCRLYGGFVLVVNCRLCVGHVLRVVVRLDVDCFFYNVPLVVQKSYREEFSFVVVLVRQFAIGKVV